MIISHGIMILIPSLNKMKTYSGEAKKGDNIFLFIINNIMTGREL